MKEKEQIITELMDEGWLLLLSLFQLELCVSEICRVLMKSSAQSTVWLGSLAVACRTSDREVARSTPGRSTAR